MQIGWELANADDDIALFMAGDVYLRLVKRLGGSLAGRKLVDEKKKR